MDVAGTCPICFDDLAEKETASPDVCDHVFCLFCIQKWAKQGTFCPVDRKRFKKIIDLSTSVPIQIKPRKRKKRRVLYDISTHCEVCTKTDGSDTLLLCDCCDLAYHCQCLTPPLANVPPGVWHCPVCVAIGEKIRQKKGITKEVEHIVMDHTNLDACSSSSESKSSTSFSYFEEGKQNRTSLFGSSSRGRRRDVALNRKNTFDASASSSMCSNSSTRRTTRKRRSLRTTSSRRDQSLPKLRSLRPRQLENKIKLYSSAGTSEEDIGQSNVGKESCSSNSNFSQDEKSTFKVHSKQHKKINNVMISETDSCSNPECLPQSSSEDESFSSNANLSNQGTNQFKDLINSMNLNSSGKFQDAYGEIALTPKSFDCYDKNDFAQSTPLNLTNYANKSMGEIGLSFESHKNDICVIESTTTLKSFEMQPNTALTSTVKDEESIQSKILHEDTSFKELSEPNFIFEDICISEEELSVPDIFDSSNKQYYAPGSSNVDCPQNEEIGKPVFSVFEKLENTSLSQKKYAVINMAVNESCQKSKYDTQDIKNLYTKKCRCYQEEYDKNKDPSQNLDKCHKCNSYYRTYRSSYTQTKKYISKELRDIEKEKWKTFHLRSQQNRMFSQRPTTYDVNPFPCSNEYSVNYNKFLSVAKPLWKKTKWDKHDTVIMRKAKLKRGLNETGKCKNNYKTYSSFSKESNNKCGISKDVISIETEKLIQFKESESDLLQSVLCLPDTKNLKMREDGSLFVDWCNSYTSL